MKEYMIQLQQSILRPGEQLLQLHWASRDANIRQQIANVLCQDVSDVQIFCKSCDENHQPIRAHYKILKIYFSSESAQRVHQATDATLGINVKFLNLAETEHSDCAAIMCLLYLGKAFVPIDDAPRIRNTMAMLGLKQEVLERVCPQMDWPSLMDWDPIDEPTQSIPQQDIEMIEQDETPRPASAETSTLSKRAHKQTDKALHRMFYLVKHNLVRLGDLAKAAGMPYHKLYSSYRLKFTALKQSRQGPIVIEGALAKALNTMLEVDVQHPIIFKNIKRTQHIQRAARILAKMRDAIKTERQQKLQRQQKRLQKRQRKEQPGQELEEELQQQQQQEQDLRETQTDSPLDLREREPETQTDSPLDLLEREPEIETDSPLDLREREPETQTDSPLDLRETQTPPLDLSARVSNGVYNQDDEETLMLPAIKNEYLFD